MEIAQLKYRIWNKTTKQWVGKPNYFNLEDLQIGASVGKILGIDNFIFQLFTGHLSKDKKEIFEGDVVYIDDYHKYISFEDVPEDYKCADNYFDIKLIPGGFTPTDEENGFFDKTQASRMFVIGNICENPELLEYDENHK